MKGNVLPEHLQNHMAHAPRSPIYSQFIQGIVITVTYIWSIYSDFIS